MLSLITWVLVTPPPTAVTVAEGVPRLADEDAAIVSVLVPLPGAAMLAGAKLPVTPVGSPLTENTIAELNPLATAVVNTMRVDPPRTTLALAALDESVKDGDSTVRAKVWVLVMPPPTAVTISEKVPGVALELAASVNVRLPLPGAGTVEDENVGVTPLGTPLTDRVMAALKPVPAAVTMVSGND